MQYSYNWLKKYVPDVPQAEELANGIIFHAFEVESLEDKDSDTLLEIKVLPDRNHDCLCHLGMAREVSAIYDLKLVRPEIKEVSSTSLEPLMINIMESKLCRRYVGRRVSGVKVGPSPLWLKNSLESIGQRSINNIVDATNYVMFDLGQPLHAFDADKIKGSISVRLAKEGEKITTLDNKEIALNPSVLVIADDEGPLAIAGIKGGARAEVDENTTNIILESANFDPVSVRKTSAVVGIHTDASKRFENELSRETAGEAMFMLSAILSEVTSGQYGEIVDEYPTPIEKTEILLDPEKVNKKLSLNLSVDEMLSFLKRLKIEGVKEDDTIKVIVPHWRIDLQEDINLIEEIGRLYGYEKIVPQIFSNLPEDSYRATKYQQHFLLLNKVREVLVRSGFTEVLGYALTNKGEVELANPLASDKGYLRSSLVDWLSDRIAFNLNYVLFDDEPVKIFEIGRVFNKDLSEKTMLVLGWSYRKKQKQIDPKNKLEEVVSVLSRELDIEVAVSNSVQLESGAGHIFTIDLNQLLNKASFSIEVDFEGFLSSAFTYNKISVYPRIIRDVAVWVPEDMDVEKVGSIIKNKAGGLCVEGPILFDEFVKEGKKSLAFRLVFQSFEKTLSDDEANNYLKNITEFLQKEGWEVR